jgi:LysM repeat protein
VSGPTRSAGRGTLTPPVLAASAFLALSALAAVAFVTARGGLQLPVAATGGSPVAIASPAAPASPAPTGLASAAPTPAPTPSPAPVASGSPAVAETPPLSPSPGSSGVPDPLAGLPACPGHPGCHVYTVRRGDSYSGVSDRYGVGLWIMDALNPEVGDKRVIVVGQALYLGHDPTARLDACPDGTCHLYVVRAGDTLSAIAGRYRLTVAGIEARNAGLDPSAIVPGQVIRLPPFQPS